MNGTLEDPEREPEEEELQEVQEDEEEELPEPGQVDASLDEILAKRADSAEHEEDEESIFELSPEERMESLSI
ncbi:MAG: hypothetical protein ACREJP_00500, partial [Candidatus Methylomirabilales bacterium]